MYGTTYHEFGIAHALIAAERDRMIEWYSPLNFSPRQEDIFNSRQPGTGQWLLDHALFRKWKSGINGRIWCRGMRTCSITFATPLLTNDGQPVPAKLCSCASLLILSYECAKSDSSIIVDNLRSELACDSIGVAVVYLNHKETDAHSPSKLLASLWRQLVFRKPISSLVHQLYEKHYEPRTRPSLVEDQAALCAVIADYSKVFILVDALDEYPEAQRDVFLRLLSTLGPGTNLLVTSRSHITIDHVTVFETLEIRAREVDIRRYLQEQMKSSRLSKHIRNSPDLRETIETTIVQRSDGMCVSTSTVGDLTK